MKIQSMFAEDIDRKINGVVKVDQDTESVLEQELREYIITNELKKHFITFFNNYSESFQEPTADMGVWISGFFGSGKSHFLKMLSYILANQEVGGKKTVEWFRDKFSDDPATFMLIDNSTQVETDTILFNIDIEGSINKDKTAVLRVFAKMFYNYLGFYGENLKVAKLEQHIDKQGKTDEFRRVFEEKNGAPWVDSRDAFAFYEDDIVASLQEVLGMSETAAQNWFNGTETVETSIAQLVSEIKEYVDGKGDKFRLLFMIDEVGQYIGADTDLLINLQSLVEKLGSECNGKVWVVCTGQEALDEIIKAREDEFSRIMARFKTRLSLTSSSADEVIQKRVLKKTEKAETLLENVYAEKDSVLRNLFSFTDARQDIRGYATDKNFAINFPFIPYQFILMQKVFSEIRKHGNTGKHLSGGERSMLSGFQEAAQKVEDLDEMALVPFYMFYDTVHTFLDSSIRRVIERCEKAADSKAGIEKQDVDVLKLLYLIRYVDDVPSNLDNIVILMANKIDLDKITMREQVRGSLDRLEGENYIGRVEDTYKFLTDEEQDIQREIHNTPVDTATIVERISNIIFGDIYTAKKFRYEKYDFAFDQMVDNTAVGSPTGGMKLRIITAATDPAERSQARLLMDSKGQAIIALSEAPYYEQLESAMKIRKYVKMRNVAQLPKSVRDIISNYQSEAEKNEQLAKNSLAESIFSGEFYVDGEKIDVKPGAVSSSEANPAKKEYDIRKGKAKNTIDQSLEYLVSHVYSELALIAKNVESDAEIIDMLTSGQNVITGAQPNRDAAARMEEYLEMQSVKHFPTSMADIQSRYQAIPYGWREIDIAAVMAILILEQKVTIKYQGATIQPDNPKLPDMLRKKSETGKTMVSKRQVVSASRIKAVRDMLRDYLNVMDVPEDEDGLIRFIVEQFEGLRDHYQTILSKYNGHEYPDKTVVIAAEKLIEEVLTQQKDNVALIEAVLKKENELFDSQEDMLNVEAFFKTQVTVFDAAVKLEEDLRYDRDYIKKVDEANEALNTIRKITMIPTAGKFDYKRIPELNDLMNRVNHLHDQMLVSKREELSDIADQCINDIRHEASSDDATKAIVDKAEAFFNQQKSKISDTKSMAILEGLPNPMWSYREDTLARIEKALQPPEEPPASENGQGGTGDEEGKKTKPVDKIYKPVFKQSLLKSVKLETPEEVDAYVDKLRDQLKAMLEGADGIELK